MLYVVNRDTDLILGRWDAWYIDCEKEASELIAKSGLEVIDTEITFMGDKVIWVK